MKPAFAVTDELLRLYDRIPKRVLFDAAILSIATSHGCTKPWKMIDDHNLEPWRLPGHAEKLATLCAQIERERKARKKK